MRIGREQGKQELLLFGLAPLLDGVQRQPGNFLSLLIKRVMCRPQSKQGNRLQRLQTAFIEQPLHPRQMQRRKRIGQCIPLHQPLCRAQ
ncbi:hypothetical protein C1930_06255 [Stenotrophomonas sp. SAU14A_NAIMI4_8]|nr:hypothetical protein C1930_06255 [Stenotrophomonas sp. SAU14A_NAIMI4_8]